MGRPRGHHHDSGDDGPPEPRRHAAGGVGGGAGSVAQAQEIAAQVAQRGRAGANTGGGETTHTPSPDDVELAKQMDRYEKLGGEPPKFNVANNDALFRGDGAHTSERHGPDVPLRRDAASRTIEGRIYGDSPWTRMENFSHRWTDPSTMNRTINDYVRENWEDIRSNLATDGVHRVKFDAHHRVGEGYFNVGMHGAGPRQSRYSTTSFVSLTFRLVPGSDPPQPFIVTAFPSGLM
jgi:hypothetical protein